MRRLAFWLWLFAAVALIGGFCAIANDVSAWPFVRATVALSGAALTLDFLRWAFSWLVIDR